jgi:hypothetical protein
MRHGAMLTGIPILQVALASCGISLCAVHSLATPQSKRYQRRAALAWRIRRTKLGVTYTHSAVCRLLWN